MELSDDISVLKGLVTILLGKVEVLETENAALRAENADLRNRLKLNSGNSHKPPSSDGLKKKPGLPRTAGKKSGGQSGHKGKTLEMVAEIDSAELHHAASCSCCGKAFEKSDVVEIAQRRQVFDIPEPRLHVTEHQLGVVVCCGERHLGSFPAAVSQPVQYGSRIKALSVLLNNDYRIPLEKIEQLMGDLWGCTFNESTVVNANASMYEALEEVEQQIKEEVLASQVAHFDETGMRVAKKLHWFHVASTTLFTYLFVHPQRGGHAFTCAQSLIKDFKNRAVHDCLPIYFTILCIHSLCCAHLLRELANLMENNSQWARLMHQFILELYQASEKATVVVPDKQAWESRFKKICLLADQEEPPPIKGKRGKPKNSKGRNLLNRLVDHQDEWLAFAFVENAPFSNNQAERDIRCVKTKQKVATNFQTLTGAQRYARIQSFSSTLRKHSMSVFQNLVNVFDGKPVLFQAG
jgi:transposase